MPLDPDSCPGALQREADWVRRLAHRLVADPHRADDLAQDAWVALLEGIGSNPSPRSRGIRSPRAWMAGTLRNLAARRTRADSRRAARELTVAREEATPAADDVVAEVELHRELTGALLRLNEPYRSTLLLRFHRALPLKELARLQEVSVTTAHNRVRRGIELLRAELDRGRGSDRGSWILALWPLAEEASKTAAPLVPPTPLAALVLTGSLATGVAVMSATAKIAAVSLIALGVAVGIWRPDRAPIETRGAEPLVTVVRPDAALEPAGRVAEVSERALTIPPTGALTARRALAPSAPAASHDPVVPALITLEGRVVDLTGSPVGGVAVHHVGAASKPAPGGEVTQFADQPTAATAPVVRTGADGRFRIDLPSPGLGSFEVRDAAWATVVSTRVDAPGESRARAILVAPRGLLAGFVHDPDLVPLAGVHCSVLLLDQVYARVGVEPGGDLSGGHVAGTVTATNGRFSIERGPTGGGLLLLFEKDGYGPQRVALGEVAAERLDVELEPLEGADVYWGVVVDAAGDPVEGATVSGGGVIVKTGAAGAFRLERGKGERFPGLQNDRVGTMLCAAFEGYLPAEVAVTPQLESPVVLRIDQPALTQRGRVVDGTGRPVEGVAVWSPDLTLLGMELQQQAGSSFGRLLSLESVLSGSPLRHMAITGADGSFELKGLLDRDYAFRAYDPVSLALGKERVARPGGGEIELTLETDQLSAIAGHLLSTEGEPLAGVMVLPMRLPPAIDAPWPPPHVSSGRIRIVTNEDGAFAFDGLSAEHTTLSFKGAGVTAFHAVVLADESDLSQIEVRVGRQVSFFIDLSRDPALADAMEVLDATGEPLEVLQRSGNVESTSTLMQLRVDGRQSPRTAVFSAPSTARTLVLYRAGQEIVRITLELAPGEINRIVP